MFPKVTLVRFVTNGRIPKLFEVCLVVMLLVYTSLTQSTAEKFHSHRNV